jgi:hypothetical protein
MSVLEGTTTQLDTEPTVGVSGDSFGGTDGLLTPDAGGV